MAHFGTKVAAGARAELNRRVTLSRAPRHTHESHARTR
jgi:hypothetical protein